MMDAPKLPRYFITQAGTPKGETTPLLEARRKIYRDAVHSLDRLRKQLDRLGTEDGEDMLLEWEVAYRTLSHRSVIALTRFEEHLTAACGEIPDDETDPPTELGELRVVTDDGDLR